MLSRLRRILVVFALVLGLAARASAANSPLIIQISPVSSITGIVAALGGSLLDSIPGANIYLLNVPAVPSTLTASLLGIQWMELNQGVTQPGFAPLSRVSVPPTVAVNWYKDQPSLLLIR